MANANGEAGIKSANGAVDKDEGEDEASSKPEHVSQAGLNNEKGNDSGENADGEDEEDEEDSEPYLKYTKLTGNLGAIFRGKDSASATLVSGGKFIVGTHNGSIYVFAIPSLETLRTYKAHSASVTAISISPYAPSLTVRDFASVNQDHAPERPATPQRTATAASFASASPGSPNPKKARQPTLGVPHKSAGSIHIATSSIDGHVCVSSLLDEKDVTLRNFARPVQAVAVSPDYRSSRSYLSGGLAGQLILSSGGRQGASENANTINAAAAASGWLGQIGLGSSSGRDSILHQGEGAISAISWSLGGHFIAWANETGIKIMRSNIGLGSEDSELAWRRIGHIDRPQGGVWKEDGLLWQARLQWIDETSLAKSEDGSVVSNGTKISEKKTEKLLAGWGDTVWMLHVYREGSAARSGSSKGFKKPDIIHKFPLDDGVISGLSMLTSQLLLCLIYRTRDDNDRPISSKAPDLPRRGIKKRQNGMPPELRLLKISSESTEELDIEILTVDRYATLSFTDYHMSTIAVASGDSMTKDQRSSLGLLSDGLWDVSRNATRLFSSNASVMSGSSGDALSERRSVTTTQSSNLPSQGMFLPSSTIRVPELATSGLKIFIVSPFDAVLAVRRDRKDHLYWLKEQKRYEEAWNYLDQNPDVLQSLDQTQTFSSRPDTPSRAHESLAEFLDDTSSSSSAKTLKAKPANPVVIREKRTIGDLWIRQLVGGNQWSTGGEVSEKVLDTANGWDEWLKIFIDAGRYDEISPHLPKRRLYPPITASWYERILVHYIENDQERLQDLLNTWSASVYNISTIIEAIRSKLGSADPGTKPTVAKDTAHGRGFRLLQDCLAGLYITAGQPADALRCYLIIQKAEPAIALAKANQLFSAIADCTYQFATIRIITTESAGTAALSKVDELTNEPIHILASAAAQNVISVDSVVAQFRSHGPSADPYLFFYVRTLFNGEVSSSSAGSTEQVSTKTRRRFAPIIPTNTTRQLLIPYADLAVTLFATYSPPLLHALLRARDASDDPSAGGSLPYTFEHASAVCESHNLTSELVYLLAETGQTRDALQRICEGDSQIEGTEDDNNDKQDASVRWAIAFCREADDQGLWDDLLHFSLSRPAFLRGLLYEIGISASAMEQKSGLDAIQLIETIPNGLPIPGLKPALERLMRDADVQRSIAAGAAQVLRSEIANVMEDVVAQRKRGVAFGDHDQGSAGNRLVKKSEDGGPSEDDKAAIIDHKPTCTLCDERILVLEDTPQHDFLLAFVCGHVYHLNCLLDALATSSNRRLIDEIQNRLSDAASGIEAGDDAGWRRGRVGNKIIRMQIMGRLINDKGCLLCERNRKEQIVD